jgi:hypothetical protein
VLRRLGSARPFRRFCASWFVAPLSAPSFADFWRRWNPPFAYLVQYYVYRPLRRIAPRPLAILASFAVSGFLLGDLPFGDGVELFDGRCCVPDVTILMTCFGVLVVATKALRMNLADCPAWARVAANAALLAAGFALKHLVLGVRR